MAASGGYYLACAATKVYALPTALVGSIGVIYLRPVLEQLLAKIGVEFSVYKSGEFKDMTGFWRAPSDRESEKFQELINEIFDNFVTVVANGRSLEESKVREVATGEVLTAQRGINVGLVDEIGDFKDALEALALLGNCKPSPKWVRPSRSFSQRLLGRTSISGRAARLGLLDGLQRIMAGGFYYLEPGHISGGDYSLE
jgi:protease-4